MKGKKAGGKRGSEKRETERMPYRERKGAREV